MKCQICNNNEANIIFTQIINNEKIVLQICSECARKKGLSIEIDSVTTSHSPESFLGGLFGASVKKDEKDVPDLKCSVCGLTFAEFKKTGLFGCDACLEAFGVYLTNLLQQIHGTTVQTGSTVQEGTIVQNNQIPKGPKKEIEMKNELEKLRIQLKKCVEVEEYENAAKLRDRIAVLEKGKKAQ